MILTENTERGFPGGIKVVEVWWQKRIKGISTGYTYLKSRLKMLLRRLFLVL